MFTHPVDAIKRTGLHQEGEHTFDLSFRASSVDELFHGSSIQPTRREVNTVETQQRSNTIPSFRCDSRRRTEIREEKPEGPEHVLLQGGISVIQFEGHNIKYGEEYGSY